MSTCTGQARTINAFAVRTSSTLSAVLGWLFSIRLRRSSITFARLSIVLACTFLARTGLAYTVVTSTNPVLEQQLIAGATNQFAGNLYINPFFGNTYQLTLTGLNPNYNAPLTNTQLLNAIVTVDSYTYVYGWADGTTYTRAQDAEMADYYFFGCTSTSTFAVPPPNVSSSSWVVPSIDSTTCQFITNFISNEIWSIMDATPTVVPGLWQ